MEQTFSHTHNKIHPQQNAWPTLLFLLFSSFISAAHSTPDTQFAGVGERTARCNQDRVIVNRARKIERFLSQPFFVAEIFTRIQGSYVSLDETIHGFSQIVNWSEGAFYLKGTIS